MDTQRLLYLFQQHDGNLITNAEKTELYQFLSDYQHKEEVIELFEAAIQATDEDITQDKSKWGLVIEKILSTKPDLKPAPVRRMFNWKRFAVAASILLVVGTITFVAVLSPSKDHQHKITKTKQPDLNPGSYKARLTLADGRTIILDSVTMGELARQGNTVIINKDGQLVYDAKGKTNEVLYNTLSTSKGESYSTVLADGSKVWLNSAASIKYPVAFTGNDRKVEITGEAYFEVAHNASMPFKVNVAGKGEVEVLGTHFNISAYENEGSIKTTLLEGSVKTLVVNGESVIIKPGQQSEITNDRQLKIKENVDLEKITAWKNNVFMFSGDDIQTIMRQIERWYDVDVEFKGQITDRHFTAIISRNNKVSEVLKMLQGTEKIQFEIEGKKIIVSK